MINCLFIGGSKDGLLQTIDNIKPHIDFPIYSEHHTISGQLHLIYQRERYNLMCKVQDYAIYALDSMPKYEWIRKLMSNYYRISYI